MQVVMHIYLVKLTQTETMNLLKCQEMKAKIVKILTKNKKWEINKIE